MLKLAAVLLLAPVGSVREADYEAEASSESIVPKCAQRFHYSKLTEAATWCDPKRVPEEQRVPEKLQGLFWLKDLSLPDVAACMSLAIWNKEDRTAIVTVWKDFVVMDNLFGVPMFNQLRLLGLRYLFTFDESLSIANIEPFGTGIFGYPSLKVFNAFSSFPMIEKPGGGGKPGDLWDRPSHFGVGGVRLASSSYQLVRIMDGKMTVLSDNVAEMNAALASSSYQLVRIMDGKMTVL